MRLSLAIPPDFDLASAVCSHGFYLLAPNRWDAAGGAFETAVALDDDRAAAVTVRNGSERSLRLRVRPAVNGDGDRAIIRDAIGRILRVDESMADFHALCEAHASHRPAVGRKFGRLIRSASLFEDIVKVMATCNITWKQTVGIIDAVVAQFGVPIGDGANNAFPTPARLARASERGLRERCKFGYRAAWVSRLAKDVDAGKLDLSTFENGELDNDALFKALRQIMGVGDYAAANLLMLLGRYDRLAVDSELMRFYRERFPRRKATPANIRKHYERFQPFAFLAYWWELWTEYEDKNVFAAAEPAAKPAKSPKKRPAKRKPRNRAAAGR